MAPKKGIILAKTDFPLYVVRSLGRNHFLIAGGGGSAKTGVSNTVVRLLWWLNVVKFLRLIRQCTDNDS